MKKKDVDKVEEVRKWFARAVTCEGEPYVMDAEQVAAVIDESENAIVAARAGSGKTRTIVAKIVYLVARCGVKPEEIMAFVFNANAAREINERLGKMRVDGVPVMGGVKVAETEINDGGATAVTDNNMRAGVGGDRADKDNDASGAVKEVKIASTFHAFARKIVYNICDGREKCGKILAGEKGGFILRIVQGMLKEPKWEGKIRRFVGGEMSEVEDETAEDINGVGRERRLKGDGVEERDLVRFAKMMALFVNRAQQKFLAGENTLRESVQRRLGEKDLGARERDFVELGVECYRRYHWYLLDGELAGFEEYGTDFNLLVSWASKLIVGGRGRVRKLLKGKKYILVDEYQDFSQLFLSVVLAIREVVPEVRLFVVGDDWQAINRFAGSDVEYFEGFERYFAPARRYEITTNYRCNYEIVGTAGKFMRKAMKEKGGFRAFVRRAGKVVLVNPRLTACEYGAVEWDRRVSGRDRVYAEMARRMLGRTPKKGTVRYIKTLVQVIRKNRKASEILLLHRNNETNLEGIALGRLMSGLKWGLGQLGVFTEVEFEGKVRVMTMHKSKGLEAEVVIILEADEGVIPKTHPDTKLYGIFGETEEVALADQVRLFYVAMTRAKKRLYIMHDEAKGEGFVKYLGRGVEEWGK